MVNEDSEYVCAETMNVISKNEEHVKDTSSTNRYCNKSKIFSIFNEYIFAKSIGAGYGTTHPSWMLTK